MGVARRELLRLAALALLAAPGAASAARRPRVAPLPRGLRVDNGGTPFGGDHRLLATVTRRGSRRAAHVRFALDRPARVRLEAVRTDAIRPGRPPGTVVWSVERALGAGPHVLTWEPGPKVEPRTYVMRVVVRAGPARRVIGLFRPGRRRRQDAPVVRVLGVEAAATRASVAPGDPTDLVVATDAPVVAAQIFHYGGGAPAAARDLRTNAVAVTPAVPVDWRANADAPARLRLLRAGDWASGLYFARLSTPDGRLGYAPFVVAPPRLGVERVAVVLSTNTWQAYNFHDANGDGWGDSWYVSESIRAVDRRRPYLDFGVPFRFRDWDLAFVAWLNRTGKKVDFLSDDDLEAAGTGDRLRRAYRLVVFPGHAEYVTPKAYDVVRRYRDLGGNLAFLSANNFYRRVTRSGPLLVRGPLWRDAGRPEAGLVGVQYTGSDHGGRQRPFVVTDVARAPWLWDGTGLADGSEFGRFGIEIDARTASSPRGTRVLARIADLMGPGRSAEMTLYETPAGATVFAAGALNFTAALPDPRVERMLENLFARLAR